MTWRPCYCAPTPPEAHLVKGFLEDRGVPCLLRGEGPSVYPAAGLGLRVQVLVPEDWVAVAQKLVDRRRRAGARRVVAFPRRRAVR